MTESKKLLKAIAEELISYSEGGKNYLLTTVDTFNIEGKVKVDGPLKGYFKFNMQVNYSYHNMTVSVDKKVKKPRRPKLKK